MFSPKMKEIICTYGYIRKYPDGQDKIPIDYQERKIREWAKIHNSKLMKIFIDTVPLDSPLFERPAFKQLWYEIDRKDVFVTTELLEVTSNDVDFYSLLEKLEERQIFSAFLRDGLDTFNEGGIAAIPMVFVVNKIWKIGHSEYDPQP